ncbi:efflux transporter outer membrane subunit [Methylomonas sp. SURF-2]|uniref:Efflux transporter outer membrane subunit n=1 Tax=Methylomonas subterranea TaxID=2952225 RepID=A0ABT1TF78_9GAMM|nr:efflux transporter outer membrane subunit [Methylomonas sp. SURF-2]MCQ8103727.1 efflux transporter outer membrane subunit [Methylomonas sp. SURF-2]
MNISGRNPKQKLLISFSFSLRAVVLLATAMTAGCMTVGPDYEKPKLDVQDTWLDVSNPALKRGDVELGHWWTVFQDPILNRLVDEARRQNLTLQAAGVRILESRAQLGIATGFEYPQVQQANGDLGFQQISAHAPNTAPQIDRAYGSAGVGFDAGWELDVWGKFRRGVEASQANLEASIATYDDVLVTLTAEVARAYVLIRTLEAKIQVALDNLQIQTETLKIADALYGGGLITELDYLQAKTLLSNTEATIPPLQAGLRQAKNSLSVLLGKTPGTVDSYLGNSGAIPTIPKEVAVGVPADLLRRRPDIRQAENQLMSQSALIGVAKADLYPHFSLLGSINFRASDAALTFATGGASSLGDIFKSNSFQYSIGPSVSWDIFNYGRISNRVRVEDARFQALAVSYRNTVLNAAREAENAIIGFLKAQDEKLKLKQSVDASKRSTDLSFYQYSEGLVDYQRVLDSQRSLVTAQERFTNVSGEVANNLIALYKALGGGWETRAESDFVPDKIKREMARRSDWGKLLKPGAVELSDEDKKPFWRFPDW